MEKAHRRTRFETRITLERMFLARINEKSQVRLSGMTHDAIIAWEKRAQQMYESEIVSKISRLLVEAAVRGELLADNSRDVFLPNKRLKSDSLTEVAAMLDDALLKLA